MSPFLSSPSLETFIHAEQHIYPASDRHIYCDEQGHGIGGLDAYSYEHNSDFGPEKKEPFFIKGLWIPENECKIIETHHTVIPNSCVRVFNEQRYCLFLIHSETETLYAPMLQKYAADIFHIEAMATSSLRTLLIRLPNNNQSYDYFFAKLSVFRTSNHALRLMSEKECISSMGNSCILHNYQHPALTIMTDCCAFLPKQNMLHHESLAEVPEPVSNSYGMLIRNVPDFLTQNTARLYPLFALWHDQHLLESMIAASQQTPTEFIQQYLIEPFAQWYIDLLFFHHVSLEVHAQNLLIAVCPQTNLPLHYVYRDMGGVNALLTPSNLDKMPEALRDTNHYYQENHLKDASDTLERHFVKSFLFQLNKKIIRQPWFREHDSDIETWCSYIEQNNYLCNFVSPTHEQPYAHQEVVPEPQYIQYGYFEPFLKTALFQEMKRRGILEKLFQKYDYLENMFNIHEQNELPQRYPFFKPFMYTFYSHWLEL